MTAELFQIRRARPDELVELRHAVLRAGFPRHTAVFDGDEEPDTIHLAAVSPDGAVIGCVTLMPRAHPDSAEPAWQLRGMAVRADMQGKGIGGALLNQADRHVRQAAGPLLVWCMARTPAVAFYERAGWSRQGEEFVVDMSGPHFQMFKRLPAE